MQTYNKPVLILSTYLKMWSSFKDILKFQLFLVLVAIICGIYYPHILENIKSSLLLNLSKLVGHSNIQIVLNTHNGNIKEKLFTSIELATYNGVDGMPIYISILGSVYDVTKGRKHYGPGCSYNYFVGRDASASFITGEFEIFNENSDDVNELNPNDLLSLATWKSFYDKEYTYKGKLIGRFYDEVGMKTKYYQKFNYLVEQAKMTKSKEEALKKIYPDCNIAWSPDTGTKVWCTLSSGGIERSWVGYPRKLYEVGKNSYRCACVPTDDFQNTEFMIKTYDNCDKMSEMCFYNVN